MSRRSTTTETEWYADGLRFQCTQCGNCCSGPPGFVWFTEEEGEALADELGIDVAEFFDRYARQVAGRWSLIERDVDGSYDCIFLDRETEPGKALCSVYNARPAQCRTWPFWPENLESKRAWFTARRVTPCPGIDTGPLIPIEHIRIQRDNTPDDPDTE